jgi:hypothetical protein
MREPRSRQINDPNRVGRSLTARQSGMREHRSSQSRRCVLPLRNDTKGHSEALDALQAPHGRRCRRHTNTATGRDIGFPPPSRARRPRPTDVSGRGAEWHTGARRRRHTGFWFGFWLPTLRGRSPQCFGPSAFRAGSRMNPVPTRGMPQGGVSLAAGFRLLVSRFRLPTPHRRCGTCEFRLLEFPAAYLGRFLVSRFWLLAAIRRPVRRGVGLYVLMLAEV